MRVGRIRTKHTNKFIDNNLKLNVIYKINKKKSTKRFKNLKMRFQSLISFKIYKNDIACRVERLHDQGYN